MMEAKVKKVDEWKLADNIDKKKEDMKKVVEDFNTKVQELLDLDGVLDVASKERKERERGAKKQHTDKVNSMSRKFDDPVIGKLAAKSLVNVDLTQIVVEDVAFFHEDDPNNSWKRPSVFDRADNLMQPTTYHEALSNLYSTWHDDLVSKATKAAENMTEKSAPVATGTVNGMTLFLLDNVAKSSSYKKKDFIGFAIGKPSFFTQLVGKLVLV